MLIFDEFPSVARAQAFVASVEEHFGLDGTVCVSQQESNRIDPFPFELVPPIALIERPDLERPDNETRVTAAVAPFGGRFAGT
jgi:hypothetical protein